MPSSASATSRTYTLSLHDALPISRSSGCSSCSACPGTGCRPASPCCAGARSRPAPRPGTTPCISGEPADSPRSRSASGPRPAMRPRSEEHTSELQSLRHLVCRLLLRLPPVPTLFPYTTLFRSLVVLVVVVAARVQAQVAAQRPHVAQVHGRDLRRGLVQPRVFLANQRTRHDLVQRQARAQRCALDRKSTRLNSSHLGISYAVFCFGYLPYLHSFPTRRSSDLS